MKHTIANGQQTFPPSSGQNIRMTGTIFQLEKAIIWLPNFGRSPASQGGLSRYKIFANAVPEHLLRKFFRSASRRESEWLRHFDP
ncbi:hypothetical protein [Fibrobacter sp. UWH5]|uniref:hypothetical protein n=1 Tax=Fibrobacter sp. UWH5 TaxID=1896211 RepID=UPI0015877138|nr:hypothetical protein [Fibrobacter sp. UWH5]